MGNLVIGQKSMRFFILTIYASNVECSSKLATADMQSTMNAVGIGLQASAPTPAFGAPARPSPLPFIPSTTSVANSAVSSPVVPRALSPGGPSTSKAKGMQLGANKIPAATLAMQLEEEASASAGVDGNPWGTDDLIDINADEDDWSTLTAFDLAALN